jgi:hypothetical protein
MLPQGASAVCFFAYFCYCNGKCVARCCSCDRSCAWPCKGSSLGLVHSIRALQPLPYSGVVIVRG